MAWKIRQEFGYLILGRPKQPIGWVIVDEAGRPYLETQDSIWIAHTKPEAVTKCDQLNRQARPEDKSK